MNTTRPQGHRLAARRPSRVWAALLACTLSLLGLSVATMSQAAVAGNPFLIDGTVPDAGLPAEAHYDDPDGSSAELGPVNGNATKLGVIHTAATPMLGLTNPNPQTDIREVWVTSETIEGDVEDAGDIWLYLGWHRDSNRGSGVLMYEFQTQPLDTACDYDSSDTTLIESCNPWANRQPGDFVIVWDQSGNEADIILRTFGYMSGGTFVTDPSGWTGQPLVLDAGVDLDANNDAFAAYSSDRFKGEAAVNLSNTVFSGASCRNIANIIPGTVTGNSDTADYKDTVLDDFVDISNCGSVQVTKVTDPAGGTGQFEYTLDRDGGGQIRYDGTTEATHILTEDGDTNTEVNLVVGTDYTLSEDILSGAYDLESIVCDGVDVTAGGTFAVVADETVQCTITNALQQGTLTVTKVVVNDDGGTNTVEDYSFSIDGATAVPFDADGSVSTTVDAGTYAVTEPEANTGGYTTTYSDGTNASCDAVVVPAGGTGTCTITNDDTKADPTATTVQSWVLHDDLTLTGLRSGAPDAASATVTFSLYSDASCTTQVGADETVGLTAATASTSTGVTVTTTGDYYWVASYSGDDYNNPATTACGDEVTHLRAKDAHEGGRNDLD